jgi:hypothetical protein
VIFHLFPGHFGSAVRSGRVGITRTPARFLQIVTQVALQDIGQLADACPESSWMRVDLLVLLNGHPSPVHVLLQGNLQANLHANSFVAFRIARRVFAPGADMDSGTERRRVPWC